MRGLWQAVRESNPDIARKQCQEYFRGRQARTDNVASIRAYVEDRVGGRDVIWRSVREAGLPYTRTGVERVMEAISHEEVDYTILAAVAAQLREGEGLYESQRQRGLAYTRRQVAEYEQNFVLRDMSELRAFVRDHPGRRDELWPLLRESGMSYSRRDLERILRELNH